jgi:hypothetical protein
MTEITELSRGVKQSAPRRKFQRLEKCVFRFSNDWKMRRIWTETFLPRG